MQEIGRKLVGVCCAMRGGGGCDWDLGMKRGSFVPKVVKNDKMGTET
jgi:hypothetical protein